MKRPLCLCWGSAILHHSSANKQHLHETASPPHPNWKLFPFYMSFRKLKNSQTFFFFLTVGDKNLFQVGISCAKFQHRVSFYGWVINPLKYGFIMEMLTQPLYAPGHNFKWCKIPYIESQDKWILAIKSN